jgi:tRNA(Ile)-lysidine synthase TilS/MesJ
MLADGDRVAVGLSGGKDSVALLVALSRMRRFLGIDYTVTALTLDPGFGGVLGDYGAVEELCGRLGIPYTIVRTNIGQVVFDIRRETNPCSLCAKMRRGALHDKTRELGCNKLALGHNYNDAVETFVMSQFFAGRVGCFPPVAYMSRKDITVIRPMIFAPEKIVRQAVRSEELPVLPNPCPANGHTRRQWAKEFLQELESRERGVTEHLFGALKRSGVDGCKCSRIQPGHGGRACSGCFKILNSYCPEGAADSRHQAPPRFRHLIAREVSESHEPDRHVCGGRRNRRCRFCGCLRRHQALLKQNYGGILMHDIPASLDEAISEGYRELVDLIAALARVPAPSHHEGKRCEFCKQYLESFGARSVYVDEAKNVLWPIDCEGSDQITLFLAHIDLVSPTPRRFPARFATAGCTPLARATTPPTQRV